MTVALLCAVRGPAEVLVVQAAEGSGGRAAVTRRCADVVELLAAAEAGLGQVAVVSAGLEHLDRDAVAALRRSGVRVVALAEGADAERAAACGADVVLAPPADLDAARLLVGDTLAVLDRPVPDLLPDWLDPPVQPVPARLGRLVAVWGPTGAPGRTTTAVNLAAELAGLGQSALLVDADTYGGAVAQVVGLLDEAPGLAAAARAAGQGTLDLAGLARLAPVLAPELRVLTGISRPDRWPELPAAALDAVWSTARGLARWTVVDCGFGIEQDEALTYDTRAPQRNGATLSALAAADVVVAVGAADPVGVARLVRALADLAALGLTAGPLVVVTRVRAAVAGARAGDAVLEALARYAGVREAVLVPDDRAACDAALLAGRTLREVAPGSPARRALAGLAERLVATAPIR